MKTIDVHRQPVLYRIRGVITCLLFLVISHSLSAQNCSCPALSTCFACSGGLVSLKLDYNNGGIITDMTANDDDGILPFTFQGTSITIPSRTPGVPFQGNVKVTVSRLLQSDDIQNFNTSCGSIYAGQTIRHFDVLAGASVAGPLCCKDTDMDKTDPQFGSTCPVDIQVTNMNGGCATAVTWTPPTATDNCGNVTLTSTHNPGDTFNVGSTTITYTATDDYNNTKTCSFKVTVKDGIKPVIANCPANISVEISNSSCPELKAIYCRHIYIR
ncbi:MAG TPA: HYR domain-containing protein [Cyclobacteriaceae bacterium]